MSQPDPFDFSDFGPSSGGPPPPRTGSRPAPDFSTGFDPWANQPKTRARHQDASERDAFGQTIAPGTLATAGPPLKWFGVALVMAAAGVVLAVVSATGGGGVLAPALAGWLLAGPLAIGALAVYTRIDTRRRSESIYSAPRWAARLYWAVLVVCLVGIALGAWQIALWAGRQ
ncbi:hypothetical protein ACGFK1_04910 [Mycobacterium sp. NPDC048908]|uniref:hypothetical protein n=1 Tax=Mycobacterium sp. NPDC048908 TaxID=3364292 RepID=UPI00371CA4A2